MIQRFTVITPEQLQGNICYVDASTLPDQPSMLPRPAGLGVFILNMQVQPSQGIYIRAKLVVCTSVLMAEAVGLALASTVIDRLHIGNTNFLSDSEQLVRFFN